MEYPDVIGYGFLIIVFFVGIVALSIGAGMIKWKLPIEKLKKLKAETLKYGIVSGIILLLLPLLYLPLKLFFHLTTLLTNMIILLLIIFCSFVFLSQAIRFLSLRKKIHEQENSEEDI
jgi:uncharacterized membrane protein